MSDMKERMMGRAQQAARQGDLRRTRQRAAEQQSNEYDGLRWVELRDIKADPRIQVRAGGLDQDVVQRYATIMAENGSYTPFPPLELYRAEGEETLWLSAGFHRCAALELADQWLAEAGAPPIGGADAYIRPGGWQAAYWNAITDNLKHGKQMTTADLKNALYRLMGYDEPLPEDGEAAEIARLSNRQLASLLGVGRQTVSNWLDEFRRKAELSGHQWPDTPQKRLVKRGDQVYEQDTSNIDAANKRRAEERQAQDEPGKTAQANAKLAAKIDELREAVLAVVEGQPPMKWREIEFAVNAKLGRIANPGLLSGAINVLTRNGSLQNVGGGRYALPGAAQPAPSDNGYQMDEPEPEADWLDATVKRAAGVALRDNTSIEYESDEAMAARLAELLRVGSHVLCDLEDVLEQTAPVPEWVLSKLDELSKLLHGHPGQDDDIWNPGLNSLLADLNTRSRRERE